MISIADLLTPVTTDQQLESFLSSLELLGVPARSWRTAGAYRTILRVVAGAYAGFSTLALGFAKSGFLETSEGGWLTSLAYYVFDVTRIPATFATGNVTVTNSGGGIYSIPSGQLRMISSVTGKSYSNDNAFTLNPGDVVSVPVTATEIGTASNAVAGTVTSLETVLPGVSCTNPSAIVGTDEETDADLRERCKGRLGIIGGKGPRGAYAYAVRSATRTDGSAVDVNRLRISASSSTGVVSIWVASASGAPSVGDVGFVQASVDSLARPDSVTANVIAANPVTVTRTLTVWARQQDGLSASDLASAVSSALLTMVTSYPIGGIAKPPSTNGYMFATNIEGTARSAHPAIFAVDGAGADIALADGDVVTLGVTVNVRLIEVST